MPYSLVLALTAAAVAIALTPVARALAWRIGAVDTPGERRIHRTPTARLGGLAIAVGVLGVAWLARVLPGPARELDLRPLLGLTCAALPILALGVLDVVFRQLKAGEPALVPSDAAGAEGGREERVRHGGVDRRSEHRAQASRREFTAR